MTQTIAPGNILRPDQVGSVTADFETLWGLDNTQFVVSHFGFPPMPIPNTHGTPDWWQADPNHPRRIPPQALHTVWGHPIYWLPDAVVQPLRHEDPQAWAMRMNFELSNRDFLVDFNPQDQPPDSDAAGFELGWIDFLEESDFDVFESETAKQRISNWLDGINDPILDSLTLSTVPDETTGAADHLASSYLDIAQPTKNKYWQDYSTWLHENAQDGIREIPQRLQALKDAEVALRSQAGEFYNAQQTSNDFQTGWPELVRSLEDLQSCHDNLYDSWGAVCQRVTTHNISSDAELGSMIFDCIGLQEADAQAVGSSRLLLDEIRQQANDSTTYEALMNWVQALIANWDQRCAQALTQFDQVPQPT